MEELVSIVGHLENETVFWKKENMDNVQKLHTANGQIKKLVNENAAMAEHIKELEDDNHNLQATKSN